MILEAAYLLYFLLLLAYILITGLNFHRIQAKGIMHPQVVTLLLPFIVNVPPGRCSTSLPSF